MVGYTLATGLYTVMIIFEEENKKVWRQWNYKFFTCAVYSD